MDLTVECKDGVVGAEIKYKGMAQSKLLKVGVQMQNQNNCGG